MNKHFIRHFAEMVAAMVIGMMLLGPLWNLALAALGAPDLLDRPELDALAMAANMSLAMAAWMRFRRHSWRSVLEMSAAMFVPFVALFIPMWWGLLSGDTMIVAGHVLMLPAMIIAMILRRDEYREHR